MECLVTEVEAGGGYQEESSAGPDEWITAAGQQISKFLKDF